MLVRCLTLLAVWKGQEVIRTLIGSQALLAAAAMISRPAAEPVAWRMCGTALFMALRMRSNPAPAAKAGKTKSKPTMRTSE
jgi:hypothetical protein